MLGKKTATYLGSAAVALALGALVASSPASAGGDRIDCKAESGTEDASMDARFESRSKKGTVRRKFSASFEAEPGGSFAAGDTLQVRVDGDLVANMVLVALIGGEVVGDTNFDDTANLDDDDVQFPLSWPGAVNGTIVSVGTLGCSLN